jgi:glycosyltransferase involved in cell wall biosynthesis
MQVICNRWSLPQRLYLRLLPILVVRAVRGPALFKSNQLKGADLALRLARRCGASFLARCGYLLSDFQARAHGEGSQEHRAALQLERRVFLGADHCVVTTEEMRAQLQDYGLERKRISIIPNYVDTNAFAPAARPAGSGGRLVFIGRLEEQKNPLSLIRALQGLDVALDMIGDGSLRSAVEAEARRCDVRLYLHGNLPHSALPAMINAADLFVLPSRYEGHPKTLLEAMACGAAVIGTRTPGIEQVIRHNETGLLCEPSVDGLRHSIQALLTNDALRKSLGEKARAFVVAKNDLDGTVQQELAVYRRAIADHKNSCEGDLCPE